MRLSPLHLKGPRRFSRPRMILFRPVIARAVRCIRYNHSRDSAMSERQQEQASEVQSGALDPQMQMLLIPSLPPLLMSSSNRQFTKPDKLHAYLPRYSTVGQQCHETAHLSWHCSGLEASSEEFPAAACERTAPDHISAHPCLCTTSS
jgi:hypothetical protein